MPSDAVSRTFSSTPTAHLSQRKSPHRILGTQDLPHGPGIHTRATCAYSPEECVTNVAGCHEWKPEFDPILSRGVKEVSASDAPKGTILWGGHWAQQVTDGLVGHLEREYD